MKIYLVDAQSGRGYRVALMQVRHQYILENFAQQLANKDNRLELKPVPDKPTRKRTQVREGLVL